MDPPTTATGNGSEPPWGTKGQGEAAGDAPRRRQEHPPGWSRGAGWDGHPRVAQDGGPGWVRSSRCADAVRDARLQQVPGSRRGPCAAIPALFVCLPARHAPSSLRQPLRRPPPHSSPCAGSFASSAFLPSPGELLPRPRQHQGDPRRCGGKTGSCCLVIDSPPPAAARLCSERFQPGKMGTWGAGPPGTCWLH